MAQAVCVECGKSFEVSARLAKKAKVCTPKRAPHRAKFVRKSDSTIRREPCQCCRCVYHRKFVVQRQVSLRREDYMDVVDIKLFLAAAKEIAIGYYLAFRVAVNAMLKQGEILALRPEYLVTDTEPCYLKVPCMRRKGRPVECVDLDCETVTALKAWVTRRSKKCETVVTEDEVRCKIHNQDVRACHKAGAEAKKGGLLFGFKRRTLQAKFRQACTAAAIASRHAGRPEEASARLDGGYTMEALRRGGIKQRAARVKDIFGLEALRLAARQESIETTRLYIDHGQLEERRMEFIRPVAWAK